MSSIRYNVSVATIGRVIANVIGIFVVGILTRTLGPEGFGDYSAVFAYLFLFQVLADMGLYTLLVREISKTGAVEGRITGNLFTLRLILIITAAIIASFAVYWLPYHPLVKQGVMIGSLTIVFSSLVQVLMGVFQKYLRLSFVAIADITTRAVQLGLLFFLVSGGQGGFLTCIWIAVIAGAVQLAITLVFAQRLLPFSLQFDTAYWKHTLVSALPIAASLLFVLLYFKIDTVMLSLMKSSFDVGVYSIGYKVLEIVIFFPAMYVGLVMPLLSRTAANPSEFKLIFNKAFKMLFLTAVPTVLGLIVFAGVITRMLSGPGYEVAVPILRILSLAVGIIFFGNLAGNAIIALNIQRQGVWIYGLGAVFNIVLNLFLIPRYSYYAAAWVTVATEALVTMGMFLLIRKKLAREG